MHNRSLNTFTIQVLRVSIAHCETKLSKSTPPILFSCNAKFTECRKVHWYLPVTYKPQTLMSMCRTVGWWTAQVLPVAVICERVVARKSQEDPEPRPQREEYLSSSIHPHLETKRDRFNTWSYVRLQLISIDSHGFIPAQKYIIITLWTLPKYIFLVCVHNPQYNFLCCVNWIKI